MILFFFFRFHIIFVAPYSLTIAILSENVCVIWVLDLQANVVNNVNCIRTAMETYLSSWLDLILAQRFLYTPNWIDLLNGRARGKSNEKYKDKESSKSWERVISESVSYRIFTIDIRDYGYVWVYSVEERITKSTDYKQWQMKKKW